MEQLLAIDFGILDAIQSNLREPVLDILMKYITMLGNGGAVWVILALLLLFTRKHRKCGVAMVFALIMMLVFSDVMIKNLVMRLRPYQLRPEIELIISTPYGYSFPSGHASASFAGAVSMLKYKKGWGICAVVAAIIISFSRLYLYVHYPSDVLCGAVIGIILALIAWYLTDKLYSRFDRQNVRPS